ncbi:MAG: VWA domain-containing protein, partial [Chloroflexaceae bacterium]|nr:VWA domain-containing protein [Chloroflexaceae bacterium]
MQPYRPDRVPDAALPGGILLPTDPDLPAVPLQHTDISATVIGPLADVVVTQRFHHTHTSPIEAVYVFPLPEDSAVSELTLTIGERVICGAIRERENAQQQYQQAREAGQGAALLEQERPNLFTISVANIQPNEQVQVILRFHDRVPYENGLFKLVLPTVVLPRYIPESGTELTEAEHATAGAEVPADAQRLQTPLLPEDSRDGHTLSIRVDLDSGTLHALTSPSHQIETHEQYGLTTVTLQPADNLPNKDFVLRYQVATDQFQAVAFTYRPEQEPGTVLLMLTPRLELDPEDVLPRELLFVFDRSGSMGGESIEQARRALQACLRGLNPDDTFNIFPFDNRVEQFAAKAQPFTQAQVDQADAYIAQIDARGGTEIARALKQALTQPRDTNRLRVIVFLTDGAVGNEDQVLHELAKHLNEARVFAFGIGSAVNRFLLKKLAETGRGTVEYLFPGEDIETAIQRFQNRTAFPVLRDIAIDWGQGRVADVLPQPVPDLYAGQPLVVLGRFHGSTSGQDQIHLRGRTRRGRYEQKLAIHWPAATPDRNEHWATLARVWARACIDGLMTQERMSRGESSALRDQIRELALQYQLMSPYTALLAVEESPQTDREPGKRVVVPIHLPYGTRREAFEESAGVQYMMSSSVLSPPSMDAMAFRMFAPPASPTPPAGKRRRGGGMLPRMAPSKADDTYAAMPTSPPPAPRTLAESAATAAPPSGRVARNAQTAYEQALRFLARRQQVNGTWADAPVVTALAVLAYLAGGHTDRSGDYRPQLTRAIGWLQQQAQQANGSAAVAWVLAELATATGAA